MLTRRKQQFAAAAFFLALALALWGCAGTINPSSSTKADRPRVRDPAGKPDRHRGTTGELFRDGDGNRAVHLPVAEKQRKHQRRDILNLHDARDGFRRQWRDVPRDRHQLGRQRDERFGYFDRRSRSRGAQHHNAAVPIRR